MSLTEPLLGVLRGGFQEGVRGGTQALNDSLRQPLLPTSNTGAATGHATGRAATGSVGTNVARTAANVTRGALQGVRTGATAAAGAIWPAVVVDLTGQMLGAVANRIRDGLAELPHQARPRTPTEEDWARINELHQKWENWDNFMASHDKETRRALTLLVWTWDGAYTMDEFLQQAAVLEAQAGINVIELMMQLAPFGKDPHNSAIQRKGTYDKMLPAYLEYLEKLENQIKAEKKEEEKDDPPIKKEEDDTPIKEEDNTDTGESARPRKRPPQESGDEGERETTLQKKPRISEDLKRYLLAKLERRRRKTGKSLSQELEIRFEEFRRRPQPYYFRKEK